MSEDWKQSACWIVDQTQTVIQSVYGGTLKLRHSPWCLVLIVSMPSVIKNFIKWCRCSAVAASVREVGGAESCNFSTIHRHYKFPTAEIVPAQNFSFAFKFPQNGGFYPKFCIFGQKFSSKKKIFWQFSVSPKFRVPLPLGFPTLHPLITLSAFFPCPRHYASDALW